MSNLVKIRGAMKNDAQAEVIADESRELILDLLAEAFLNFLINE
jgi:hypothetical protein